MHAWVFLFFSGRPCMQKGMFRRSREIIGSVLPAGIKTL
jgi:hypothetical protein